MVQKRKVSLNFFPIYFWDKIWFSDYIQNVAVGGIVELHESKSNEWLVLTIGILYLQKDYQFKAYFFRLFDYSSDSSVNFPHFF